ncbi:VOC family protein [Pelagibacterium mangrovi]|uniref:VOC family protein n=1 Tax=Pelagibacterium mangrovi TaxID=3119828 RepID=UPI002FCC6CCB
MAEPASRMTPMLSVADIDKSLTFYRDVLGGEIIYQFPPEGPAAFLTLRFGTTELGMGQISGEPLHGRPLRPATGHRIELCINVADTDAAVAALNAIGAPTVLAPTDLPWGERAAYVEDPDGNLVMLAAPVG